MSLNIENVLQKINKKYVNLKSSEMSKNKDLLNKILNKMLDLMKKDDLFKTLYETPYYGGSSYEGLKVEKPNEFDMDFLLVLPKVCETHKTASCDCLEVICSNKPGFFWFKMKNTFHKSFSKFINDDYVQTNLVLNWLQSLVRKALNEFSNMNYSVETPDINSMSGPALVLKIDSEFGKISVDLVLAFKFGSNYWPKQGYRQNLCSNQDFVIVPKKADIPDHGERYWRASFQAQEKELITGKGKLKPALRLLKKMRNNLKHDSISSYALKTIILWNLDTWNKNSTLTEVFLGLLREYKNHLLNGKIKYFWNEKYNLLDRIGSETLKNHANEIKKKIERFEKNKNEKPLEIAKIILKEGSEEYQQFMKKYEVYVTQSWGTNSNWDLPDNLYDDPDETNDSRNFEFPNSRTGMIQEDQTSNVNTAAAWIAGLAIVAVVGITVYRASRSTTNNR
ncbi:cyclic GMP-AMP synthase-like receptor [Euwallacea similis]|uniref:cyclic GMP-AMP synthase-like receptor n=1 Tax=Euwallacea similis TaxID=1736056 RepID=UPI00344E0AEA